MSDEGKWFISCLGTCFSAYGWTVDQRVARRSFDRSAIQKAMKITGSSTQRSLLYLLTCFCLTCFWPTFLFISGMSSLKQSITQRERERNSDREQAWELKEGKQSMQRRVPNAWGLIFLSYSFPFFSFFDPRTLNKMSKMKRKAWRLKSLSFQQLKRGKRAITGIEMHIAGSLLSFSICISWSWTCDNTVIFIFMLSEPLEASPRSVVWRSLEELLKGNLCLINHHSFGDSSSADGGSFLW